MSELNTQSMVRTVNGGYLPTAPVTTAAPRQEKKLLIVLQHYDGDVATVEKQAELIADLERIKNPSADILIFSRNDSKKPFGIAQTQRLQSKFNRVHTERCRRIGATGYPYGPNEMFYDLVSHMAQNPKYRDNYFAFINLESDVVPTRPGWISEIIKAYRDAEQMGKMMVGHYCERPVQHMNGVGVYATDIQTRIGMMQFIGGPANVAYDMHHGHRVLPIAADTPLIYLEYRRPTINAEELFAPRKQNVVPALWHGVKDESALTIVRNKFINLEEQNLDLSKKTVFTYFDKVDEIDANEQKAQIELWKDGWKSRGFNPVVLTWLDAAKHPLYAKFEEVVKKFPTINPAKYELSCFLRWLALDNLGGGLHSDYDVLPSRLIVRDLEEIRQPGKFVVMQSKGTNLVPSLVYADKAALKTWIDYVINYKPDEKDVEHGRPHVSDQSVARKAFATEQPFMTTADLTNEVGEGDWRSSKAIHFANGAVKAYSPGSSKSNLMVQFLRS